MKEKFIRYSELKVSDIALYIMAFLVILSSASMFTVITYCHDNGITEPVFVKAFCVVGFIYWMAIAIKRNKIKENGTYFCLAIVIMFLIYIFITQRSIFACASQMCLPILVLALTCSTGRARLFFENFLDKYSQEVFLIAIISLVFYFGGTIGGFFPKNEIQYYNNGGIYTAFSYFNIYFENPLQNLNTVNMNIPRNVGIFMEAPGFGGVLIYALFWNLVKGGKKNRVKIFVLITTMITTFSTKAIIMGGLLSFLYYYLNAKNYTLKAIMKVFTPLLFVLGALSIYLVLKLKMSSGGYGSMMIRLDDIAAAWKTFLQHPFFGAGFYNLEAIYANFTYNTLNGNPTCGFLNILAYGGIFMGAFFITGLILFMKSHILCPKYNIIFLTMIVFLLFTSAMQYNIMLYLFVVTGYVENICNSKRIDDQEINQQNMVLYEKI